MITAFKQYLLSLKLSPVSRKLYSGDVHHFLHWMGSEPTLSSLLSPLSYQRYLSHLRAKALAPSMLKRTTASLRQFGTFLSLTYDVPNPIQQGSELLGVRNLAATAQNDHLTHFTNYLERDHLSPLTIKSYKSDITRYLHWASTHLAGTKLPKLLTEKNIGKYLNHLSDSGSSLPSTIERKAQSLARFQTWYTTVYSPAYVTDNAQPAPDTLYSIPHTLYSQRFIALAILLLFVSSLGIFAYRQFSRDVTLTSAYPSTPVTPNRQLSFQGRLENAAGTPITTATNFVFKLFTASSGGTELYSTGTCSITPDTDGVFNTQIGSTCGSAITSSVFTENAGVWLEVTVVAETLAPRQQIATVAYALNAETLQGFPLSATISAIRNTIVPMNRYGEIIVGEQSPRLTGVSGTFQISAPALSIITATGTNGNITLAPDGTGQVNLNGNTTSTNFFNVSNAQLTTGSLITGTVANANTGFKLIDLLSGVSPTSKFSVSAVGTTTMAGDLVVSGSSATLPNNSISPNEIFTTSQTDEYCLTYEGTGTTWEWQSCAAAGGGSWSALTVPTANLSLAHAGYTTAFTFNSVTTADAFALSSSSLTTGTILDLSSTSTAGGASGSSKVLDITRSGTNANASHTAYGLYSAVTNTGTTSTNVGGYFSASGGTNNYAAIFDAGNVGIGTTAPGAMLDVAGKFRVTNDAIVTWGGAADAGTLTWDTDRAIIGGAANKALALLANGEKVRITTAGNVGIGTTGPGAKLHVYQGASGATPYSSSDLVIEDVTRPTLQFLSPNTVDQAIYFGDPQSPTAGQIIYDNVTDSMQLLTNNNNAVYINSTGNVGIGTTGPGAKLHVSGAGGTNTGITVEDTTAGFSRLSLKTLNNEFFLQTEDNSGEWFGVYQNGGTAGWKMVVQKDSGNVGIGTTSPIGKLHVEGACVTGDTLIKRRRKKKKNGKDEEDWDEVPVTDIEPGDEIMSLDEQTGEFVVSKVRQKMNMGIQETYLLVTESGKQIRTTAKHPYLTLTKKSALADFGGPTKVGSNLARHLFQTLSQNRDLSSFSKECGPSGICTRGTVDDKPGSPLKWAHTTHSVTNKSEELQTAKWQKVSRLKPGMQIATVDGFETIISLTKFAREQVYDLEIDVTHNFVGNGIVAHNTTGKALAIFNETGDQNILTASQSGIPVFNLARVAGTAANGTTFTPSATGNAVTLAATGSDTNIAYSLDAKGSGALNLNGTATGDVNLAGGYGGTGCTVTNSNGNLSCNGTITGTIAGTIPWSEIDVPTANLSLAHAGYTTAFTFDSVTTADAFALSSSSLTTGTVLDLSSTSTAGGVSGLSKVLDITRSGTNANASHTAYGLYSSVTNTGTTSTNVGGYFSASGATNNYGLIVANGNVGIGTTGPGAKLQVASNVATAFPATSGSTQTGQIVRIGGANPGGDLSLDIGWGPETGSPATWNAWLQATNRSGLGTNYNILLNPNGGNVGIGTTGPGALLDVNGTSIFRNTMYVKAGAGNSVVSATWSGTDDGNLYVLSGGVNKILLNGNGSSYFNAGNVGIGTTGPGYKLEANESVATSFVSRLYNANSNGYGLLVQAGSTSSDKTLSLRTTAGTERTVFYGDGTVTMTGNVGIGTTAPTTALHVGTSAETHTLSTGDALISSDLELDGVLYLDGGTISNSAGTASLVLSSAPTTTANTLSASNWLIENTANVGQAALIVNQTKAGDLFTASASGTPKFTIANTGAITSAIGSWASQVADSATAVGFTFNTTNTLSTQGSKLLSFQNLGTEKMYLDKDGNLYVSGTLLSGNGTSMLLTNKSGGVVANRALVILDSSNNSSFTTTTTPYNKAGFGVVVGVGLGVTNDADGDGACDANDICMVAYGGEVEVTVKNASTAVKGDYLFTSDTAGSAVASAKQYDGLVGAVSNTAGAGSGYVKMIFKVQPQVTAAAAIDKTTKHNEYWLYADQYQAVGEGANTDTNLLQRGLAFDTFSDSTKTDSANTTVSYTPEVAKGLLGGGRVGLIGGQTMSTATTDNDGQTYLGSNTVNDIHYYDRTKDSDPQVQVELGIDPNWYNGVTLSVATTSAQFSQNSVITQKNPNLSTSYNGSLVKVTGTDATPRTIYITIKSPTTFDWTNYQGDSATGVTITPGTAQALGDTGVSATFTNARYNTGDVFKIASWFIEAESATRGAKQQFPERSNVIATASSVDIIDADTQKLWMRFSQGATALSTDANNDPSSVQMLNGHLYVSLNGSSPMGLVTLTFDRDSINQAVTTGSYTANVGISQRNSGTWTNYATYSSPTLVNNVANDVSAAVIPNQPTQEVTVSGWGYMVGNNTTEMNESVALPYKFNNSPTVNISQAGLKVTTAPTKLSDCSATSYPPTMEATSITQNSFTAQFVYSSALATTAYYCYTWTATGQVSPRQYVGVATNGGVSLINETDQSVVNGTQTNYNLVTGIKLLDNGNWYEIQNTTANDEHYLMPFSFIPSSNFSLNLMRNTFYSFNTTPNIISAYNISINSLDITKGTSTIDGKSNTLYIGTGEKLVVLQEKRSGGNCDNTNGCDGTDEANGSVKYYTKDYISEEMVGDIRGMWPLSANGALSMSDASVKADTLTNNNTATAVTGVRGAGVSLNGTTQYLSCTDAACGGTSKLDSGGTAWSVGAWVKRSVTGASHGIITKDDVVSSRGYGLYISTGDKAILELFGTSDFSVSGNTNISANQWYFVVGTYDGANMKIYVNGQLEGSDPSTGNINNSTAEFDIGSRANGGGRDLYFNGTIDEPFVTATALTPSQIKHMYEVGYRALQSHATTLGGGAADTNQQLGFISTGTNTVGDARPDWNNQFMYVGTNSTTLGAVSKIDLNSDTNIKTYNSSANVPTGGALLIDEDTKSLAVGYNLEAVGSAASGVKTMGVDNNATATSGNFIGKTVTTAESFTQAYLWAQYTLDASDASNTIQVWASNDGGSNYSQCNLTNTDTSRSPSEYEYFCQFNTAGSSLKTKFVMARGSTKTNTWVSKYGIAWIDSNAVAGSANGSGLFTNTNASVANGSYIDVAHNQNSNDLVTNGWVYNTATSKWEQIDVNSNGGTGGTITYTDSSGLNPRSTPYIDGYTVHTFTTSGTFTPNGAGTVDYLVVGGGGGGGNTGAASGGGGGGGVKTTAGFAVTAQDYTVTVGGGGNVVTNGSDSVFSTITSTGGGAGGNGIGNGSVGGSGGGGGNRANGAAGTAGQGSAGGNGNGDPYYAGGGGGGAGATGGNASTTSAGNGGNGIQSSLSGTSTYYAGGGGGGRDFWAGRSPNGGSGGLGGGGASGTDGAVGTPGTANTGGGGGANSQSSSGGGTSPGGGAGGSGIVIVRYLTNSLSAFKITQQDANTVRLYNYSGSTQNLRLDVITGGLGRNAGTVSLAPAAADVDSAASTNSIWINKTGSGGNLLKLQTSGTDVLSLTGAGVISLTGSMGIGIASPDSTALLDLTSTTKGFLAPRMTGTQRDAISTPATGLMIYNTDTNQYNVFNGSTWGAVGGGGGAWSDLTVPTANLSLAHAGYTTAFTFDSLTTADAFALSSSSLTTGTLFDLSSTSTAGGASGVSKLLDLTRSGTNANASHTAYGLYSAVTNTGTTSTNISGYFSASGATNNYGLIVENGNVGIGNTTPVGKLDVSGAVTGKALAIFNETGDQDILVASASGVTRFRIGTDGYAYAQRFADTASSSYYLDPAAAGTSLMIDGDIVSDGAFSITSNATNGNITLDAGSGTVLIGSAGAGKLDAGTIDPPYTINGDKFATYMAGMTGVKEETTGVVQAREFVPGSGYRATLDFAGSLTGSDLWLFSKTSNLENNLDKMVVLLSTSGSGKSWYQLDASAGKLYLYSQSPATISYRLTAPRYDALSWANTRGSDSESIGHVVNDDSVWSVPQGIADAISQAKSQVNTLFGNLETNLITPLASDSAITIQGPVVISPLQGTEPCNLQGSVPCNPDPLLVVEGEIDAATISARVAILTNIQADTITARNIVADTITANHIEGLDAKIASLSAGLSDSEVETITDRIKARLALLTGNELEDPVGSDKYPTGTAADIPVPQEATASATIPYTAYSIPYTASSSASLASADIDFATINDYLAVIGQAVMTTLTVNDMLYTNSIQSKCPQGSELSGSSDPCSSSLALQPLGGIINLASGTLIVDSSGQVAINGDLTVSGKILAQSAELATLSLGTPSSATDSALGQLLQIYDESGKSVATIDASGSANLAALTTNMITIAAPAVPLDASSSGYPTGTGLASLLGTAQSNATAGESTLVSPNTELTIESPYITPNSLVYLTPTTNTDNKVLFVKSKESCTRLDDVVIDSRACTLSFTVAIDLPASSDISFNWWIIQLAPPTP